MSIGRHSILLCTALTLIMLLLVGCGKKRDTGDVAGVWVTADKTRLFIIEPDRTLYDGVLTEEAGTHGYFEITKRKCKPQSATQLDISGSGSAKLTVHPNETSLSLSDNGTKYELVRTAGFDHAAWKASSQGKGKLILKKQPETEFSYKQNGEPASRYYSISGKGKPALRVYFFQSDGPPVYALLFNEKAGKGSLTNLGTIMDNSVGMSSIKSAGEAEPTSSRFSVARQDGDVVISETF